MSKKFLLVMSLAILGALSSLVIWTTTAPSYLSETAAVPVEEVVSIRNMEIGTYGYLPPMHLDNKYDNICIWEGAQVRPYLYRDNSQKFPTGPAGLERWILMLKVERQEDGFHASLVSVLELGLNDTELRTVLQICE